MMILRPRRGRYRSFAELARHEREGTDYTRFFESRGSRVAVVAPHGGGIEPGTSEIARAVAGTDFSVYTLEGQKPRGNEILHVTSGLFDDPQCLGILAASERAVTIHGCEGREPIVHVGGLDDGLIEELIRVFLGTGLRGDRDETEHSGKDPSNICNRCASARGVQLEISRPLRASMFDGLLRHERAYTTPAFRRFVEAVRGVLLGLGDGPALT